MAFDPAGPDDDFRAAGLGRPSEVKLFDYIYGVLHSPAYRETFAEFLLRPWVFLAWARLPTRGPHAQDQH